MSAEITPEEKAEELLKIFSEKSPKMGDHSIIYSSTAKHHALLCCREVMGYMGADRGYQFWAAVEEILENK